MFRVTKYSIIVEMSLEDILNLKDSRAETTIQMRSLNLPEVSQFSWSENSESV